MTFAEILLLALGVAVLFRLLRPLERWVGASVRRSLRSTRRARPHIIDITRDDKKDHVP